jgi:CBS domain-containing protein
MKVSDVMSTEVETVRPDQMVREAARFMLQADAGSIPVTEGNRLVGMITDRDIAVRGVALGYGPETPVSELMTSGIVSAHADELIEEAARKMGEAQVRRLPVIDHDQRLVGIVSLGDLARKTDEETATQALEGVSAEGEQHRQ